MDGWMDGSAIFQNALVEILPLNNLFLRLAFHFIFHPPSPNPTYTTQIEQARKRARPPIDSPPRPSMPTAASAASPVALSFSPQRPPPLDPGGNSSSAFGGGGAQSALAGTDSGEASPRRGDGGDGGGGPNHLDGARENGRVTGSGTDGVVKSGTSPADSSGRGGRGDTAIDETGADPSAADALRPTRRTLRTSPRSQGRREAAAAAGTADSEPQGSCGRIVGEGTGEAGHNAVSLMMAATDGDGGGVLDGVDVDGTSLRLGEPGQQSDGVRGEAGVDAAGAAEVCSNPAGIFAASFLGLDFA